MHVNIVLRTCTNSLLAPSQQPRICGSDRALLMRKCFASLARAIRHTQHEVTMTVLDDHSDAWWLEFIQNISQGISTRIIHLNTRGAAHSGLEQFKHARDSQGLVYVVEDDYLHETGALDYMVGAYEYFLGRYKEPVVIHPHDCALRYAQGSEGLTMLYYDGIRYWRSVDKTTFTMLTHAQNIRDYWPVFENLAANYPRVLEDDTINKLYRSTVNPHAPLRLFNPIPSVAYHMGYGAVTGIGTEHTTWQGLWQSISQD